MTLPDDAGFNADLLDAVAREHDVDPGRLAGLAVDLQAAAESVRGVDGLVFEYRKSFGDVVARRTETTYFLRVPAHVWPEYKERLDASDAELDALRAVHARQFEAAVGGERDGQDGVPLVLRRR